jgi:hypothetical protein
MIKKLIAATLLLIGAVIWMAPAPFYSPNYALSNQYPVIALGGGNLGVTNQAAFRALIGVTSTASTNNQTLTGSTVISTNLLVDARTSPGTISPTNIVEFIGTNGLKLFNIGRATGWTFMGTNVVFKLPLLNASGSSFLDPNTRILIDSLGATTVDWDSAYLASGGNVVLDWGSQQASTASGALSIGWGNRQLYATGADLSLDWESRTTSGPWAFTGASGNFTNSVTTSNLTVNGTQTVANLYPTNIVWLGRSNAIMAVSASGALVPTNSLNATNITVGTNLTSFSIKMTDSGTVIVNTNTFLGPTNASAVPSPTTFLKLDGGSTKPIDYIVGTVPVLNMDSAGNIIGVGSITLAIVSATTVATAPIFRGSGSAPFTLGSTTTPTITALATNFNLSGVLSGTNGLATYSTTATNAIAATGITNTSTFNRHAMLTVTAVAFAIKNYEGTIIYNSPAALTATMSVPLQPGGAITAASGLSGTLLPY